LLSIIIPNRNGVGHIERLFPSLSSQTYRDFEVVLVDNASSDSSVEVAGSLLPYLRILRLPKNYGFAAACNKGADMARGEILLFLNSDTELDRRCLKFCVDSIDQHDGYGFFQPKILKLLHRDVIDGAGDLLPRDGRPVKRAEGAHASTQLDDRILSPCGAASLWRRKVFFGLGGFEESFFAYLEDVDLGLRASISGIKGKLIPDAIVYHEGGGSAREGSFKTVSFDRPESVRWIARNKIWLWARCLPLPVIAACAPWMFAGFLKSALHHTFRSGARKEFRRGTMEGLAGLGKALAAGKSIRKNSAISNREILNWMKRTSRL